MMTLMMTGVRCDPFATFVHSFRRQHTGIFYIASLRCADLLDQRLIAVLACCNVRIGDPTTDAACHPHPAGYDRHDRLPAMLAYRRCSLDPFRAVRTAPLSLRSGEDSIHEKHQERERAEKRTTDHTANG
jgi:hypothetical protein